MGTRPDRVTRVCAAAVQLVLEEVLLSDVHMHPYELLGWEGVFGTIFMAIVLPVLHVLPGAARAGQVHAPQPPVMISNNSFPSPSRQQQDIADLLTSILQL